MQDRTQVPQQHGPATSPLWTRRQVLESGTNGFGMLALAQILAQQGLLANDGVGASAGDAGSQMATRLSHHAPKAKRVIFLFMPGGPPHVDLFDPKPALVKYHNKKHSFTNKRTGHVHTAKLYQSPFRFKKHGESGTDVSNLFPHVAECVDDIAVIRSMWADNVNHNGACLQMNTGEQAFCRPSLGSWLLYGLGTENQNLPGFVTISPNQPAQGAPLWGSSFLPAAYQGTFVQDMENPIHNLGSDRPTLDRQRKQLDLLGTLNGLHRDRNPAENELDARIASFELAFRMQATAPEAFDIDRETDTTKQLYGIDNRVTEIFGRQCLMARRLVESGVRMVQLYHTKSSVASACQLWDFHSDLELGSINNCAATDLPIAGLLKDLKMRGLLDETLVIWSGEFGRTPTVEGANGRGHHPFGFTTWMAGGGVKGGIMHGATDEFGWHAEEDKVHVHDLHATILHLMGLDHERLTYHYSGRNFRLTDVYGRVVNEILA
jgi:hypothetical protein